MTFATASTLSPAACARTVLAAGTWLTWTADGADCWAPYFEDGGTPVLLVERRTNDLLIDASYVSTTSYVLPTLGVLRIGGSPWTAVGNACLASMRAFRLQHGECDDCCGARRSHLVGVRIDRVEFAPHGAGVFAEIDLDAFLAAEPDPIVTHSVRVRTHLNAEHHEELRVLAARLLGVAEDDIAAATLEWIDALGVEVAVIGAEGSRSFRFPFRVPLTSMDDLGGQLHQLLNQSGPSSC